MNIFILDTDPKMAAHYHCDQHVIKMILESAQMLCSALRAHGSDAPYRTTHPKHPCTLWAQETTSNWLWLKELAFHLDQEYQQRYKKNGSHKSWLIIESLTPDIIPEGPLTPFAQAMPNEYKHADPVVAYRQFYCGDKAAFATWKYSETPYWFKPVGKDA